MHSPGMAESAAPAFITSNQDLVMGVASAGFMLIRGVASAIGCMLILVPKATRKNLEPMDIPDVT